MILTAVLTKYYKSVETLKCVKGLSGNGQPLFDAQIYLDIFRYILNKIARETNRSVENDI